jgi:hypothetical protein
MGREFESRGVVVCLHLKPCFQYYKLTHQRTTLIDTYLAAYQATKEVQCQEPI